MSIEGKVVDAASGPPDDPEGLQREIERTREHLGETVEALVAKVDVKARAQDEAGRLIGRLKGKVAQARQQAAARAVEARRQAAARAVEVRRQAADKTAGPRQKATVQGRHVRRQVAEKTAGPLQQATSVGGSVAEGVSKVTPEPVKQAAGSAVATARQRRTPLLAAVGAIGAGLVGWLLFQRWRRRG